MKEPCKNSRAPAPDSPNYQMWRLIEQAKQGDKEAFGQLYQQHHAAILRFVKARVKNPSDAEDIISDVFLHAFKNIRRFDWQGISILAWLYRIALNLVVSYYRSSHVKRSTPFDTYWLTTLRDPLCDVEDQVVVMLESEVLRSALKRLEAPSQEILTLYYLDELSMTEVAQRIGISVSNTKARIHRARRRLLKALNEQSPQQS